MNNLFMRSLLSLLVLAAISQSAFALDFIYRKSTAEKLSGNIESANKLELVIKSGKETIKVPANDIERVEWDDLAALKLAINEELRGNTRQAADRYNRLKSDPKAGKDPLKAEVFYLSARANARLALAEPSKRDEAIKELEAAQKTQPEHFRYYDSLQSLARLYMAKQDYPNALAVIELIGKAPWNETKLSARLSQGRIQLLEGKQDDALKTFDEVAKSAGDGFGEQARKYEAKCGRARVLVAQNKYEEAMKLLDEVTEQGPPEEAAVQADAYLLRGNCQQALNQPKLAALEYLHVDVLYSRESAAHAEALYQLSKMWRLAQAEERANAAAAKLRSEYPSSEWVGKLAAGPQ